MGQVAASTGRLYLDPSFLVAPNGTLEPLQGRLDGDAALRVKGAGKDLQGFLEKLRHLAFDEGDVFVVFSGCFYIARFLVFCGSHSSPRKK